jgi:hypothetical protein
VSARTVLSATAAALLASAALAAEPAKHAPADFAGVWMAKQGSVIIRKTSEGFPPPFQPWAREQFDKVQALEKAGKPIADNVTNCTPHGLPRIMGAPFPIQIVVTPKIVFLLHEAHHVIRFVYMDEQHPKRLDPTYMGHSVGHWDGDALVIDTIGFNTKTVIDREGIVHSDALHVIERLSLSPDGKQMSDLITVDDPKAFTKPWSYTVAFNRRPDIRIMEYVCDNNEDAAEEGTAIEPGTAKPGAAGG